ncbi:MAG: oligopeptide transporter, family [Clostridia bacterium]|nr:oligopeptide transporter, family [Clostridia bacterium]
MEEKKGLSHSAYGGVKGDDYMPYIPASQALPEITAASIILGALFAILFGAANTYLGLKVGLTISASIPTAILATGILKGILRRNNILEANVIQSVGSVGESIAGGLIFTLPAVIIWGLSLDITTITVVALLGSLLGVLFIVPLRRFLTIEEHGSLVYPEGMAAAEVLVTGSTGGTGFRTVITGLTVGGIYKIFSGGFKFWMEEPEWTIRPMQNTIFGIDVLASLLGVGYIVGIEAALYMMAGSVVAWLGLIPLIKYIGGGLTEPLFPAAGLIRDLGAWDIWSAYIRYVGAGAVAAGGFIGLAKSLPAIISSFRSAIGGFGTGGGGIKRTEKDIPMTWVIVGAALVFFLAWFLPAINLGAAGSILVVVFSFFFAVVSARLVGIVGVSNNPVSGMTIASLLIIASVFRLMGEVSNAGMMTTIIAGAIVCVAISTAGSAGQNLKTTFIVGGTPRSIQIGSDIPAPQATLMSMVVKGVLTAQLPWTLVIIGAVFGIMCELAGVPVLTFALGLYLPIHLSGGIVIGGIIRVLIEKKYRKDENLAKQQVEKGVLLSSGLVAGDALMGIVVAAFAGLGIDIAFGRAAAFSAITGHPITATVIFLLLSFWVYSYTAKVSKSQ